jgi:hypothetical protein
MAKLKILDWKLGGISDVALSAGIGSGAVKRIPRMTGSLKPCTPIIYEQPKSLIWAAPLSVTGTLS